MVAVRRDDAPESVLAWQSEVQAARASGPVRKLSLSLANLGLALFDAGAYDEGVQAFEEAVTLASDLDDTPFRVQVLSVKALAFQAIGRFHNAYEVAEEILHAAEELNDAGMLCDALTTEAQILVQSGEPVIARDKLAHARRLALEAGDKRRQINVAAVWANAYTAEAALSDAALYLQMACDLARELQDAPVEAEQLIHLGTVLKWQSCQAEAADVFQRALDIAACHSLPQFELAALSGLTECYAHLDDAAQVLVYAERGAPLAAELHDSDAAFKLLEAVTLAAYRTGDMTLANEALGKALALARSLPDRNKEADLLVNLGEAYLVSEQLDQALRVYHEALDCARRLKRPRDEAYLVGRIGFVHAEQGALDEALRFQEQALELARQSHLDELEADQLCMLALTYWEQGAPVKAVTCCHQAIDVYDRAGIASGRQRAETLLAEMDSP